MVYLPQLPTKAGLKSTFREQATGFQRSAEFNRGESIALGLGKQSFCLAKDLEVLKCIYFQIGNDNKAFQILRDRQIDTDPEKTTTCIFYQGQGNVNLSLCSVILALKFQLLQLSPYLTQRNIFVQADVFLHKLLVFVKGFGRKQLSLVFSDPEKLLYIRTLSNKYGNADGLGHVGD